MIRLLLLLAALVGATVYASRLLERRRRDRLAIVRSAFLVTRAEGANHEPARDASLRSGAVRLRIPAGWAEEYPDSDHATFRDPTTPGRVLRVASELAAGADSRGQLLARAGNEASTVEELPAGRLLLKCLDTGREPGQDTLVFRWLTAEAVASAATAPSPASSSPTGPATAGRTRVATFALSLPDSAAFDPLSRELLAFVEREVRAAGSGAEQPDGHSAPATPVG